MSISSMTNVAFSRRKDTEPVDTGPSTLPEVAESAGQPASVASSASSTLAVIATYIPTEIVTLYVSVLAVIGVTVPPSATPAVTGASPAASVAASAAAAATPAASAVAGSAVTSAAITPLPAFVLFVVLTPFVVWILYATKVTSAGKPLPRTIAAWPKWEMSAATIAFAVWAGALPSSPLGSFSWFNVGLAGIGVLLASTFLGLLAPLFTRTALANS